jgi:hypothetical protein
MQCWTASQNEQISHIAYVLRSQTGLWDKDSGFDQGTTNGFFFAVCKSAWKWLGGLKPTENNARSSLWVTPTSSYSRLQCTDGKHTCREPRERERASWERSATWRSYKINNAITVIVYACTSLSYAAIHINSITGKWGKFCHYYSAELRIHFHTSLLRHFEQLRNANPQT